MSSTRSRRIGAALIYLCLAQYYVDLAAALRSSRGDAQRDREEGDVAPVQGGSAEAACPKLADKSNQTAVCERLQCKHYAYRAKLEKTKNEAKYANSEKLFLKSDYTRWLLYRAFAYGSQGVDAQCETCGWKALDDFEAWMKRLLPGAHECVVEAMELYSSKSERCMEKFTGHFARAVQEKCKGRGFDQVEDAAEEKGKVRRRVKRILGGVGLAGAVAAVLGIAGAGLSAAWLPPILPAGPLAIVIAILVCKFWRKKKPGWGKGGRGAGKALGPPGPLDDLAPDQGSELKDRVDKDQGGKLEEEADEDQGGGPEEQARQERKGHGDENEVKVDEGQGGKPEEVVEEEQGDEHEEEEQEEGPGAEREENVEEEKKAPDDAAESSAE